jgi:hypothetical protein
MIFKFVDPLTLDAIPNFHSLDCPAYIFQYYYALDR